MFVVTAAEFTVEGTANDLINLRSSLWGCSRSILGKRPPLFLEGFARCLQVLRARKIAISSYHLNGNGGVERVNHTMAQMLVIDVNERQNNWDVQLSHVKFGQQQFSQRRHRLSSQRGPHG